MKSDTTENRLLGKGAPDNDRPCKQQDIDKEDANDWTNKGIIESKATDQESDEDDEYWDTLTDADEHEATQIDDSDEETFWECPTEPEDVIETEIPVKYEVGVQHQHGVTKIASFHRLMIVLKKRSS